MSERLGSRAVVLGAGMAGLVTARVLADRYAQVVVVERNTVVGVTGPRAGVPQGHHAHALLARGQEVMERLFPGMQADLTADGVLSGDLSGDLRWYFRGRVLQQSHSGLSSVSANRPTLEAYVRRRVVEMPDVVMRERTVVQGLVTTADHSRVTGVRVVGDEPGATPETIDADLVVDATGRGSRTPAWLEQFGYPRPAEDKVRIDLAYVSQYFRLRTDPFGTDLAINSVPHPGNMRGAFFGKFPDNVALLSLTGLLGDHPPRDREGFLEFARSLDAPEIYEAVRTAEPLTEPAMFRVPASVRRRYEKLTRFPDGLLVVGDGVCAFNPVYGQGMTVAAMEADALAEHLGRGPARPREFFRAVGRIVDVPWETSVGGDLALPAIEGKRTAKVKVGGAFMARLHTAAQRDGAFTRAFFRVAGLVDPPSALMKPGFIARVLRSARRVDAETVPAGRPDAVVGQRAVVVGGSVAGTLAARVLSDHYHEVVVVDRDEVLGIDVPRRGTPHTAHAHGLHGRGYLILTELFPGLRSDLQSRGVPVGDLGEMRWYFDGRRLQPARTGLLSITTQRPVLEEYLRSRVAALPNVTYRQGTELTGLRTTADNRRVTAVALRDMATGTESVLGADLVIDATGRGSRLPVWLEQLGYQRPVEERMKIGLAYTTRLYRKRPEMFDGTQSINPVASPAHPRGAFFGQVGEHECIVSLTGILGDHPPSDPDGFLAFARSLPVPDVYDGLRDAEPLTEPVTFTFPASLRRRYERLSRFPERLLVLGDAVCSFNPVYGQGMTVAAIEAMTLRKWLLRGAPPEPRGFLRDIGRVVDVPWQISTSGDLDFPGVPGKRSAMVRMGNAYMARVQYAATKDPSITARFMRVAGLIDPPSALMLPGFVRRVLRLSRDRTTGPAAASLTAFDPTDQVERAAS
ncbi:FAD-dependent monooxygenase [Micromonospora sp. NBC_01813]|nr:FAD-dependent oxidoreductase [Micromonospora sp. NBC_01813]WSA10251.1 FAD-dependent monooxygenase [Micromonospora sp. NBC_01813]